MSIGFNPDAPGVEGQTELIEVSRITDLSVGDTVLVENGAVVGDLDQSFVIATNSFLLTGGDGYVAFQEGESLAETVSTHIQPHLMDFSFAHFNSWILHIIDILSGEGHWGASNIGRLHL